MELKKISKFKLILFLLCSSLFYVVSPSFDVIINTCGGEFYFVLLFSSLLVTIIYFFLPKILSLSFKYLKENFIANIIVKLHLIVNSIMVVVFASSFIQTYFNVKASLLIFIFILVLSSLILSKSSLRKLIDTSIIFCLISILSYVIPFLDNQTRHFDYLNILNVNNIFKYLFYGFMLSTFILDIITISFYSTQVKQKISKNDFFLYCILLILIIGFIYFESTTLITPLYYKSTQNSSFFHWILYKPNKYINNYDIMVFIIMLTSVIFKISFNLNFLKSTSNPNSFVTSSIFASFMILIISSLIYYLRIYYNYFNIILLVISFIVSLFSSTTIIILLKKGEDNERDNQET